MTSPTMNRNLTAQDSAGRDAAWYAARQGTGKDMYRTARALMKDAEAAAQQAREALQTAMADRRDADAASRVTEFFDGQPLIVLRDSILQMCPGEIHVRSPLHALSAVVYQPHGAPTPGTWAVSINDSTHEQYNRKNTTDAGGTFLGFGWSVEDALLAAKTWVATGVQPQRP
jgi:hypothetical protein